MRILVIAEHDNQCLKNSTLSTLTAAANLSKNVNASIEVLVAGWHCEKVVETIRKVTSVERVLWAEGEAYANHIAENMADLVISVASTYAYILAPATTFGKNFLPRVAAQLNVEQISDVCGIHVDANSKEMFLRPIYAGNALETVVSNDPIKVLTIRTSAFNVAELSEKETTVEKIEARPDLNLSQYLGTETTLSERPDLSQAKIIVSGGRGFQSAEKFKQIEALADKLNAAIGASRAAVDAGFAPNDYQVGQTGKIVAPNLYIAIGISGAIQHLAGMKDSRVIVAINKDPDAPIFKMATYGLVGDLFTIIPEFIAELDKIK